MNENRILNILESLLGKGKKQSKGEYIFYCPVCNHYKPKLIVKVDQSYKAFGSWHCWICQETHETRGRNLFTLLKRFDATESQRREMEEIIGDKTYSYIKKDTPQIAVKLPAEYIPLWDSPNTLEKRHAMQYLKGRKITEDDIKKYQIGYCENGDYSNRIVIPSYDENGVLNYFVSRRFFEGGMKHKNPEASKDVIGFDLLINWSQEVVICEGPMDAISIKRNAIPLFGKIMMQKLYGKILLHKPKIIIYLDDDAIDDSIKMAEKLYMNGIDVYLATPPNGEDPGSLSFNKNLNIIRDAKQINIKKIIQIKLKI